MRLWVEQKDSFFSDQKLVDIENLSFNEQLQQQELARKESEKLNNLRVFGLLAAFAILLTSAVLVFRNISLRRKNERLNFEKANTRLRQEANELEMQVLRSQMNPHFIFNCLNAINRYILMSDPQTASDYLTKFSRLMRMALNHSKQTLIPLEDELAMLKLYLDLEKLRFKDAFNYEICIGEEVDAAAVFIPPLLLQPFVENAIWHGLMHRKGQGRLLVRVRAQGRDLVCEIEDNGVGRARAAELRSKSAELKKSMGIGITKNRLELLDRSLGRQSAIEIEDLYDDAGRPAGTRVVLSISPDASPPVSAGDHQKAEI
jgi:LytS/YehU family sensor histidine kinase